MVLNCTKKTDKVTQDQDKNLDNTGLSLNEEDEFSSQSEFTEIVTEFEGKDVRQTQKAGFINNTNTATINGNTVKERQSLSKALRPEADE